MRIPELLSDENSLLVFLLVTVLLGGGAAWLTGRALALTWRPAWQVAGYMLILALAVRFIHFAVFDSKLLSLHYYLVDYAVCLACGLLGFRVTRVDQMLTRYSWIMAPVGLLSWRRRDAAADVDEPKSG